MKPYITIIINITITIIITFSLLIGITLLTQSCSTTNSLTFGDITILNSNGEVIRQWDDSILDPKVFKNYPNKTCYVNSGVFFTDNNGEYHYVAGGVIVIDNIETIYEEK